MWIFLEQANVLVEGLVKALVNLPEDDSKRASAKRNLACRSMRRSQHKQRITEKATANSTASNILLDHVSDENDEFIPGLLTYLMEGLLPMLKVKIYIYILYIHIYIYIRTHIYKYYIYIHTHIYVYI